MERANNRDFVHVHDVARLLVDLAINEWPNPSKHLQCWNWEGSHCDRISIPHSQINRVRSSFDPVFQSEREGDIERSVASIVAIENDLGWKLEIQLEEGLEETHRGGRFLKFYWCTTRHFRGDLCATNTSCHHQ